MNQILIRAKEVQYKKIKYMKEKHEKRVAKLNNKIELLNNKIAEQDKVSIGTNHMCYQIKLYNLLIVWLSLTICDLGDQVVSNEVEGICEEQFELNKFLSLHRDRRVTLTQTFVKFAEQNG